jgi:mRNA interferase RelE/StbE
VNYTLLILPRAARALSSLPRDIFLKVDAHILKLRENPRPPGCKKLRGRGGWRMRVGSYRVVYEIDDGQRTIVIQDVAHRRDVYR